jgi:hypothetical protein
MNPRRGDQPLMHDRVTDYWQRGMRFASRVAIAFGLATVAAILLGAAVTDNAFVQILVTFFAAIALWLPFVVLVTRVERYFSSRRSRRSERQADRLRRTSPADHSWHRLAAIAPAHSERLAVLQRSLESSRLALGKADLDPDAHELCVLIDRRLPELIQRELECLPPDDRGRERQLHELVELIEQFARHCSRKRSGDAGTAGHQAAILRRRFEARLSEL